MPNCYILGGTGTGKTTLLYRRLLERLDDGGLLITNEPVDILLSHIPDPEQVVLLYPHKPNPSILNLMDTPDRILPFMREIAKFGPRDSTPVFDILIRQGIQALSFYPDSTLLHLIPLLINEPFRREVLQHCTDPFVSFFWEHDFETMSDRDVKEKPQSVLNKLWALAEDERIRHMVGYHTSTVDFSKLVICSIQGFSIERAAMISRPVLAAFNNRLVPVYLDNVHLMQGPLLDEMLSTRGDITMAHQYLDQLTPEMQSSVLGKSAEKIVFRCSLADQRTMEEVVPKNMMDFNLSLQAPFKYRHQTGSETLRGHQSLRRLTKGRYPISSFNRIANERYRLNANRVRKWQKTILARLERKLPT